MLRDSSSIRVLYLGYTRDEGQARDAGRSVRRSSARSFVRNNWDMKYERAGKSRSSREFDVSIPLFQSIPSLKRHKQADIRERQSERESARRREKVVENICMCKDWRARAKGWKGLKPYSRPERLRQSSAGVGVLKPNLRISAVRSWELFSRFLRHSHTFPHPFPYKSIQNNMRITAEQINFIWYDSKNKNKFDTRKSVKIWLSKSFFLNSYWSRRRGGIWISCEKFQITLLGIQTISLLLQHHLFSSSSISFPIFIGSHTFSKLFRPSAKRQKKSVRSHAPNAIEKVT